MDKTLNVVFIIFKIIFTFGGGVDTYCGTYVQVRGQFVRLSSLPPFGTQGLNSGYQAWKEALSAQEPSGWPEC